MVGYLKEANWMVLSISIEKLIVSSVSWFLSGFYSF